jgi:iron complex transport system substrate-binding protein
MTRTIRALVLSSAIALLAAACGDEGSGSADTNAVPTTQAAATSAPAETAGPATTPAGPTASRIVSLSPTATEMLFAIGAGDLLVAVDDMSNYPAEALDKQTELSGYTPNVEAIAAFEPDLVVHDGTTDVGDQLDALGIAHWVGAAATSFDDIYVQIEQLGAATGRVEGAADLVAAMQADIAAAVAALPTLDEPLTFFHELDPTLYSVTSNTFVGQVYTLLGLRNIADGAEGGTDYPQLGPEFVISENPDLIFLADSKCCGESPEGVTARPGWDAIDAVSAGRIIVIDDDIASRWGPRVVELIDIITAAVADAAEAAG